MKTPVRKVIALLCGLAHLVAAGQGPAGSSGACMHVVGPVGSNGQPIGFTCTDVGGSALLVWNAAQLTGTINVTGGIKTVNLYPGSFSVDGIFKSDGSLAFIGGGIVVSGSITGSNVLIAGINSNATEVTNTLLGGSGRITSSSLASLTIVASGKVSATSGNVTVAGSQIANSGQLTAKAGTVALKTGSKMDVGWTDAIWLEGVHVNSKNNHSIRNDGTITATNAVLEAHRASNAVTPINNAGTISVKDTIKFVAGLGGNGGGTGSFGIFNASTGKLYAAKVIISPYEAPPPAGTGADRTFTISDSAQRQQLVTDIGGGQVFVPQQDNTPTTTTAPVIDAGRTFTVTSNLVIPQLAPSMTHLNATSQAMKPTLVASNGASERVRGDDGVKADEKKSKPRAKAKPVLVRGAFFDSKISAAITSNP